MFVSERLDIDRQTFLAHDAKQVIEARSAKAATPAVHSRTGCTGVGGDLPGTTHKIDQFVCERIHAPNIPIIGTLDQAKKSDNRDCDNRTGRFQGAMQGWSLPEIRQRMETRLLKNADMARQLGLAPNKVSKIFQGERRITADEMAEIQRWLADDPIAGTGRAIPIIGQVAAGRWREAIQQPLGAVPAPDPNVPPNAVALTIQGDSMDKYVQDGGTIIFDPDDRALFPGKFYVVINAEGETTFKMFAADPARLVPCSLNPAHTDIVMGSGEAFEVVGRVIWRASRM